MGFATEKTKVLKKKKMNKIFLNVHLVAKQSSTSGANSVKNCSPGSDGGTLYVRIHMKCIKIDHVEIVRF